MTASPNPAAINPAAIEHLPPFITPPGETDVLMVVTAVILLLSVLMFGLFFLRLHTMPERMAHRSHKLQFEIVAVMGLIALFTHMHIFWIAGLLLAMIDLPDFVTPLRRIAGSSEKIAGLKPGEGVLEMPPETIDEIEQAKEAAKVPTQTHGEARQGDVAPLPSRPEIALANKRG